MTLLPPREGFGPEAVGAIGLIVNRLGQSDDIVIGQATTNPTFPNRQYLPAATPLWPPFGRAERYLAGIIKTLRPLAPTLIETHNRASFIPPLAAAFPTARQFLFIHNDPQAMRGAKTPAQRSTLLTQATIICVSHHLATRFMQDVENPNTPIILPNALDLATLPPQPIERHQTILFAGRIVADKGADAFVRVCAAILPSHPAWRAEMIGADRFWPNSPQTPFQHSLAPKAAAANIRMHGYLPHNQVLQAMAQAAIVIVPSRWPEPFGLTALEAMASGAALICSPEGGLPEVAGDAALYAHPDDPNALENALKRLMDDAALRTKLSCAGRGRAVQFDAAHARQRLTELRQHAPLPIKA